MRKVDKHLVKLSGMSRGNVDLQKTPSDTIYPDDNTN